MRSKVSVRRDCQTRECLVGTSDADCERIGVALEARDRFNGGRSLGTLLRAIRDRRGFIVTRRHFELTRLDTVRELGDVYFPIALWLELDDGAFERAWMEVYSLAEDDWREVRVLHVAIVAPLALPADADCPVLPSVVLSAVAASKAMLALAGKEGRDV